MFREICTKKEKEAKRKKHSEGGDLLKLPQRWKSKKVASGNIFLIGFPPLLEKAAAQNALAFSQLQQVRRRLT
jgi:hypothetical protein